MKKLLSQKFNQFNRNNPRLQQLTAAALILPGLLQTPVYAADEDEADFQYSHYQEGQRGGGEGSLVLFNSITQSYNRYELPKTRAPIEVDSIHGNSRISLTDRIKFGFNYVEDSWAGATPYGSAPEHSGAYGEKMPARRVDANGNYNLTGASPLAAGGNTFIDSQGSFMYQNGLDSSGKATYAKDRMVHVMGYASPETRKQGDFKLGYQWDEAGLDVGGGVSDERDYQSRFFNLGGRMDFNQKRTALNLGLSYTNSDINTVALNAYTTTPDLATPIQLDKNLFLLKSGDYAIHGNRQDWISHLGLTQIINKDAVLSLGMGYSRNTGLLENPYKATWFGGVDLTEEPVDGFRHTYGRARLEQRPDQRNLLNWNLGWTQYVQPFDAGLHVNYQFALDDWGVNAHTFDADWVQPLGAGWALTPRIRYYSQDAANFYQPFFVVGYNKSTWHYDLPNNWSSDQRLSGFGALSGGVVLSKQFVKGVRLETGFEYYSHQGGLKLGGGGEQVFADYDYWVVNAGVKINLSSLGQGLSGGGTSDHAEHANHSNVPAGLMFTHTLSKAGDMMAGYRYQHNRQAGDVAHGDRIASNDQAAINGCPGAFRVDADGYSHYDGNCPMLPTEMVMNMHMLELMYAPTDRLTLMLMPQFSDMSMSMEMPMHRENMMSHMATETKHESGGIGDTGAYALYTLFDRPGQHLHISLGGTVPTGAVGLRLKEGSKQANGAFMDYGMQLSSGTWDLKPSLTYLGLADDWSWGAQLSGTKRLGERNASGYRLGDAFESSVWGGYSLTRWLSSTLRMAYSWQDSIQGRFTRITLNDPKPCDKASPDFNYSDDGTDENGNLISPIVFHQADYNACVAGNEDSKRMSDARDHMSSQDYPRNYGGHYLDLGLGVSATVPSGSLAGNRLSFEWLQPMYANVNGYQLNRDGALTFTWSYGF